jgi:hypothetical protein
MLSLLSNRKVLSVFVLAVILFLPALTIASDINPGEEFIRGDVDQSGTINLADAIGVLSITFDNKPNDCEDTADVNDDGYINIADAITILGFLFSGNDAPPAPYPRVGVDPTSDSLDCRSYIVQCSSPGCLQQANVFLPDEDLAFIIKGQAALSLKLFYNQEAEHFEGYQLEFADQDFSGGPVEKRPQDYIHLLRAALAGDYKKGLELINKLENEPPMLIAARVNQYLPRLVEAGLATELVENENSWILKGYHDEDLHIHIYPRTQPWEDLLHKALALIELRDEDYEIERDQFGISVDSESYDYRISKSGWRGGLFIGNKDAQVEEKLLALGATLREGGGLVLHQDSLDLLSPAELQRWQASFNSTKGVKKSEADSDLSCQDDPFCREIAGMELLPPGFNPFRELLTSGPEDKSECLDGNILLERFYKDGQLREAAVECPYGCGYDRCNMWDCEDSDSWDPKATQAGYSLITVQGIGGPEGRYVVTDQCKNTWSALEVRCRSHITRDTHPDYPDFYRIKAVDYTEVVCTGSRFTPICTLRELENPLSMTIPAVPLHAGECAERWDACTESDGGINPAVFSDASDNQGGRLVDHCITDGSDGEESYMLEEAFCSNGRVKSTTYDCRARFNNENYVCRMGQCLHRPLPQAQTESETKSYPPFQVPGDKQALRIISQDIIDAYDHWLVGDIWELAAKLGESKRILEDEGYEVTDIRLTDNDPHKFFDIVNNWNQRQGTIVFWALHGDLLYGKYYVLAARLSGRNQLDEFNKQLKRWNFGLEWEKDFIFWADPDNSGSALVILTSSGLRKLFTEPQKLLFYYSCYGSGTVSAMPADQRFFAYGPVPAHEIINRYLEMRKNMAGYEGVPGLSAINAYKLMRKIDKKWNYNIAGKTIKGHMDYITFGRDTILNPVRADVDMYPYTMGQCYTSKSQGGACFDGDSWVEIRFLSPMLASDLENGNAQILVEGDDDCPDAAVDGDFIWSDDLTAVSFEIDFYPDAPDPPPAGLLPPSCFAKVVLERLRSYDNPYFYLNGKTLLSPTYCQKTFQSKKELGRGCVPHGTNDIDWFWLHKVNEGDLDQLVEE